MLKANFEIFKSVYSRRRSSERYYYRTFIPECEVKVTKFLYITPDLHRHSRALFFSLTPVIMPPQLLPAVSNSNRTPLLLSLIALLHSSVPCFTFVTLVPSILLTFPLRSIFYIRVSAPMPTLPACELEHHKLILPAYCCSLSSRSYSRALSQSYHGCCFSVW